MKIQERIELKIAERKKNLFLCKMCFNDLFDSLEKQRNYWRNEKYMGGDKNVEARKSWTE